MLHSFLLSSSEVTVQGQTGALSSFTNIRQEKHFQYIVKKKEKRRKSVIYTGAVKHCTFQDTQCVIERGCSVSTVRTT